MKRVVVLGGALCVWEDYHRVCSMFTPDEIVCVNTAGRDFLGVFDHWCSLHPELFSLWMAFRASQGLPKPNHFWTGKDSPTLGFCQRARVMSGSSGRLGLDVALLNHATHVVLCGITLSPEFQHYDKARPWEDAKQYRHLWMQDAGALKPFTRSMNGWTKDFFGEPTVKWLASDKHAKAEIVAAGG